MNPLKHSRPARTRIRAKVEVRSSRQSFDAEAEAGDVSVLGFCFCSPIRMTVGDRAGASLRLQSGEETPLSFEVRWARPEGEKHYLVGIEFVHTPERVGLAPGRRRYPDGVASFTSAGVSDPSMNPRSMRARTGC